MQSPEKPLLNDRNEYPDDQVLTHCLGRAKAAWDGFSAGIVEEFPGTSLQWRYYNDGKSWLCKVTRRKSTVCWVSVWPKSFRTSFYFTAKSDAAIQKLDISAALKATYRSQQPAGKLKALKVEVSSKKQLADVFALVRFKIALK